MTRVLKQVAPLQTKRLLFFVALTAAFGLAVFIAANAALLPSGLGYVPEGYSLVWEDQFSGSDLDPAKWGVVEGQGAGPDVQYGKEAVTVNNDVLNIATYTENGKHHSGWISTQNKFQSLYGYYEARIKFDSATMNGMGYWLFNSLVNVYGDPWNHGVEMDIVEHSKLDWQGKDISNQAISSLNWGKYGEDWDNHPVRGSGNRGDGLATGYHVYGMEWTPTALKFYIDGKYVWQVNDSTASPVSRRDEFMILSHHPSGGSVNYGSKSAPNEKMQVDYVKVYQLNPTAPPAPTNVVRVGSGAKTNITWDLSANATSYTVKRSATGGSVRNYATIGSTTGLSYTDTSANPSSSYYYIVTAVNSAGQSRPSAVVSSPPNLAFAKPSVAKSNRQPAAAAFDGNRDTIWESDWASDPQWIYVDLQKAAVINKVTLDWTDAYAKSYKVDVSVDRINWRTVYSTTTGDGGIDALSFPAQYSRYVRMYGTKRAHTYADPSPFGYALKEFEINSSASAPIPTGLSGYTNNNGVRLSWNPAVGATSYSVKRALSSGGPYSTVVTGLSSPSYIDNGLVNGTTYYHVVTATNQYGESSNSNETRTIPRANLALWQQSYASSKINTDTQPYKAFDGMISAHEGVSSSWSSAFTDPQWISIDLQTIYPINRVVLNWDPVYGHGKVFDVQVSSDGKQWSNVYSVSDGVGGINDLKFAPTNARYVRMLGKQRGHDYGYSLREFEVYGM